MHLFLPAKISDFFDIFKSFYKIDVIYIDSN